MRGMEVGAGFKPAPTSWEPYDDTAHSWRIEHYREKGYVIFRTNNRGFWSEGMATGEPFFLNIADIFFLTERSKMTYTTYITNIINMGLS